MTSQLKATEIVGQCRGRWSWDGRVFTAQGVEVPNEVMRADEARWLEGLGVAPDDQVLDMKVALPKEALPAGFELVPIKKDEPKEEPKEEAKSETVVGAAEAAKDEAADDDGKDGHQKAAKKK